MKKILIAVLAGLGTLGVAFGASVVVSADEVAITSLDELKGKELVFKDEVNDFISSDSWTITFDFSSNNENYSNMNYAENRGRLYYGSTAVNEGIWEDESYKTILVDSDTSFTFDLITEQQAIQFFNTNLAEINTPAPAETGNLWTSILTGIGGFISGMFALISGAFTGVVSIFYANNTATIILQALIFAAAASLVAAAVYVIVRLIKSAVARLRGGIGAAKGGKKVVTYSVSDGKGGYRDVSRKEFRRFRRRK